ncbi:MAG: DMT family transporter [Beijerinckiaceae bacterium]|nr:DMT family transporter [Beijerinckiaceae bacterium]
MSLHPVKRSARRPVYGIVLVIIASLAVAIVPTAAKLAYQAGSNTLTVVTLRGAIGVALTAVLMAATGESFHIARDTLKWCVLAGLFYIGMAYGFIGSVATIPVSLAILIYFTHPLLVAAIAHWRGGERLTPRKLILALVVLAGIAIALGQQFGALDPLGMGLAAMASLSVCGMILFNARAQENAGNIQVSFYMTGVTVLMFALATTFGDAWRFPTSTLGWIGVLGAGLGVTVGLLAFFAAFPHLGAVRATMISNIEPVFSILVAVLVLGETLAAPQWIGAALVVVALVLFEWPARRV